MIKLAILEEKFNREMVKIKSSRELLKINIGYINKILSPKSLV